MNATVDTKKKKCVNWHLREWVQSPNGGARFQCPSCNGGWMEHHYGDGKVATNAR